AAGEVAHVAVRRRDAAAVVDDHPVAVGAVLAGEGDLAARRGVNRSTGRRREVQSGVAVAPVASALAEPRGQRVLPGLDRQHPGGGARDGAAGGVAVDGHVDVVVVQAGVAGTAGVVLVVAPALVVAGDRPDLLVEDDVFDAETGVVLLDP